MERERERIEAKEKKMKWTWRTWTTEPNWTELHESNREQITFFSNHFHHFRAPLLWRIRKTAIELIEFDCAAVAAAAPRAPHTNEQTSQQYHAFVSSIYCCCYFIFFSIHWYYTHYWAFLQWKFTNNLAASSILFFVLNFNFGSKPKMENKIEWLNKFDIGKEIRFFVGLLLLFCWYHKKKVLNDDELTKIQICYK